jgi:hypothetical protein
MSPTVSTIDHAAGNSSTPDSEWVATIDRYHHTAADVLAHHLRAGLRCSCCHQTWPCRAACAAAFALEL